MFNYIGQLNFKVMLSKTDVALKAKCILGWMDWKSVDMGVL